MSKSTISTFQLFEMFPDAELPNPYEVRLTAEQAKNLYEFAAAGIRVAQTNPDANTVDEDTVNEMIESVRGPINLLGAIGARVVQ